MAYNRVVVADPEMSLDDFEEGDFFLDEGDVNIVVVCNDYKKYAVCLKTGALWRHDPEYGPDPHTYLPLEAPFTVYPG